MAVRKSVIKGKKTEQLQPVLSGDRVIVHDAKLAAQLATRSFGELKKDQLYINLYEACLLLEEKKLQIYSKDGDKMKLNELMGAGECFNEGFGMKFDVFRDLRSVRGYVAKSGIKFGCDFVVYPRGKTPSTSHSKWMVHVMPESARLDYVEITRSARLAANVKKAMLFATVTDRGPVYYEISRAKL